MSPTAIFTPPDSACGSAVASPGYGVGGVVYPGWWQGGVAGWVPGGCTGEGYTGTQPTLIPGPIFNLFLRLEPTHGQMKAILCIL